MQHRITCTLCLAHKVIFKTLCFSKDTTSEVYLSSYSAKPVEQKDPHIMDINFFVRLNSLVLIKNVNANVSLLFK